MILGNAVKVVKGSATRVCLLCHTSYCRPATMYSEENKKAEETEQETAHETEQETADETTHETAHEDIN
jgi:hypothetical protein